MADVTHLVARHASEPRPGALDADNNPYSDFELERLEAMNHIYTHVVAGGKNRVVSQKPCPVNGRALVFESLDEFKLQFTHLPKIAGKRPGAAWLDWPGKKFCQGGIGIYPKAEECPDTVFNLYPGLALAPQQGDCTPYLEHLSEVICGGDSRVYQYLLGWLGHMLQRPDEKPSVAVLLKSVEGTGKGSLFKPLKLILGQMAVQVNGIEQLTGKFNAVVANKLLVFGDEVELTDPRRINRLKGLISEPSATVEHKGIDAQQVPNYARFIFAGNSERMLQAGLRERRYLLLEPSAVKAQDKAYFDRLHRWADNQGASALLHYLLALDLSGFDPRRSPVTRGLIDEKLASLGPLDSFLWEQLLSSQPFNGERRVETRVQIDRYIDWAQRNHLPVTAAQARPLMGKAMIMLGASKVGRPDRGNGKCYYELPNLKEMQARFAAHLGHSADEVFDDH